ncbi:nitrate- and nitrite sensing domain-containing protein [Streptomyces sp. NPDC001351]|uniref:nitrate- and nitrite sensing domain-containing protein n=1 Tax=Streptomyces sp. NPDC001351 TaxID=3364564 RepID=UPI0036798413
MDVTAKATTTIRTRLLRILILALAVLLTLLGVAAAEQISAYRNASATDKNARLEITLQGLVHELQKERGLTTGYVGGVGQFKAKLPAQRRATDTARAALDKALKGRWGRSSSPTPGVSRSAFRPSTTSSRRGRRSSWR